MTNQPPDLSNLLKELQNTLTPEQLREAAGQISEGQPNLFARLADVLESQTPEQGLEDLARELVVDGDAERLQNLLTSLLTNLQVQAGEVDSDIDQATQTLTEVREAQAPLTELLQGDSLEDLDPVIAEELDAALKGLTGDLVDPIEGLLVDTKTLLGEFNSALKFAGTNPAGFDHKKLQKTLKKLTQAQASLNEAKNSDNLLRFLEASRQAAKAMGREREALEFLLLLCAFKQGQVTDGAPVPPWRELVSEAVEMGAIPMARTAAQVLQQDAAKNRDFQTIADLAEQMATAAENSGDSPMLVLSLCEAALAHTQLSNTTRASESIERALELAGQLEDTLLLARTRLTAAQIHESNGANDKASTLYLGLIEDLPVAEETQKLLGLSALGAGRCFNGEIGAIEQITALTLARETGSRLAILTLYLPAITALVQVNVATNRREQVIDELVPARTTANALGGAAAVQIVDQLAAWVQEEWGVSAFNDQLKAFQARQAYPPSD